MKKAMCFVAVLMFAWPVRAQLVENADMVVLPIIAGEKAEKDGLLVPEARFKQLLSTELKVETLERRLEVETATTESAISACKKMIDRVGEEPGWFQEPILWVTVGAIIGAGAAIASVWGGTQIVKAAK